MIDYNPKEWVKIIFSIHKADTIRKLFPLLLIMGIYTSAFAFLVLEYWRIGETTDLKNLSIVHSLLGFVISLLLVFRTNTAYDRWWEGRKQWGLLINASRNLALKLNHLLEEGDKDERLYFQKTIGNYCVALKNHLRKTNFHHEYEHIETFPIQRIVDETHLPNHLMNLIQGKVYELHRKGVLQAEHLLLLDAELQQFTNICGACERIKNSPIPYSYSSFLKKFIMIYCFSLPIGYIFSLHYLIIPFVIFVFYVLASLEVIAEEIEDPFGSDANDLPLDRMCQTIKRSLSEILGVKNPTTA
jgi:putative membrane protein